MSRYIDADELAEEIKRMRVTVSGQPVFHVEARMSVLRLIDEQQTADVKKVEHGKWKQTCVPDVFQCSNCKRPTKMDGFCDSEILRAYCPNCGAKMDGGDN